MKASLVIVAMLMLGSAISKASRRLCTQVATVVLLVSSIGTSSWATPVKEAPWRPEAAAYRATLFLGNLAPIPWDRIAAAWSRLMPSSVPLIT